MLALRFVVCVPVLLGVLSLVGQAGDKPRKPQEVLVRKPVVRDVVDYLDTFKAVIEPAQRAEVQARTNGFLEKILFREGSEVKTGDVLFQLDQRPARLGLEKAQAEAALAEAVLARWNAEVERMQKLLSKNAISREEVDRAMLARTEAEINLRVARLAVEKAQLELDWTVVRAPITGKIGKALIGPGNQVTAGNTLAVIVTPDPMGVAFEVSEASLVRLRKLLGTKPLDALPLEVVLPGIEDGVEVRLTFLDNQVDPRTRTIHARAEIPKGQQPNALPGMASMVRLPATQPRKALTVPPQAITADPIGDYVYVVDEKNQATRKYVLIGNLVAGERVIREGLRADEWVISDPAGIRPGLIVTPKK